MTLQAVQLVLLGFGCGVGQHHHLVAGKHVLHLVQTCFEVGLELWRNAMVVVVVAMTLSVVVVVAMFVTVVVLRMQLLLDGGLFCQQPTPLVGQLRLE